ncbi:glycosyltransferase [Planctomycetota bacterium]
MTISIQTYNRAKMLAETLESLRGLYCPDEIDYEILVVDNNSSDNTSEVIDRYFKLMSKRLRSVCEHRRGLSYARNCALKHARSEIVGFIDDDVKVDSHWLEAVSNAFVENHASAVGGRSYLVYPSGRPVWLPRGREYLLSGLDYGDQRLVNTDKDLFGLNLSIRRETALKLGGFDTNLGRTGRSLICGEEKDLLDRLRATGGIVVYEPKAVVWHIIPPERLKKRWFFRRIYGGALSSQRRMIINGEKGNLKKLFIRNIRCWGSVFKSLLGKRTTAQEFFEKEYFALGNLAKLVETVRCRLKKKTANMR